MGMHYKVNTKIIWDNLVQKTSSVKALACKTPYKTGLVIAVGVLTKDGHTEGCVEV